MSVALAADELLSPSLRVRFNTVLLRLRTHAAVSHAHARELACGRHT